MMRNNKNKGGNYNEKIDNQKIKSTTFLNLLRNEFEKQKTKKRKKEKIMRKNLVEMEHIEDQLKELRVSQQLDTNTPEENAQIVDCITYLERKLLEMEKVNYDKVIEIVRLKQVVCESEVPIQKVISTYDTAQWLMNEIGNETQEVLVVLCLNNKNEIANFSMVHRGSLNQSIAHPRDIFQRALLSNAARIIVGHNHPSGNPHPSENDCLFTSRLKEGADLLGMPLLDHLIVGADSYYSFCEEGLLS